VIFNAYWKKLDFELPPTIEQGLTPWQRIIDTSLESPDDLCDMDTAPFVETGRYPVAARSVVVLRAHIKD
jgi:glycogen operon protein